MLENVLSNYRYLISAESIVAECRKALRPPPKLLVSEWADEKRILSATSAEPGRWRTSRTPYLRKIMDAVSDPAITEITFMASAQVGKTEGLINNTVGYHIDQDPAPMLVILETESKAEAWSKERLMPMLRDTPCLRGKVRDTRSRDSENKILYKEFPKGFLAIAGAGSEGELSSRPIRIVLLDEIDKYRTTRAGDPELLAIKRTATFWNRKIIRVSTPRDQATSRIERAYMRSNMQKYYVPCPLCGEYQILAWSRIRFERDDDRNLSRVWYECQYCMGQIDHSQKTKMLAAGEWRAEKPEVRDHAGFWLNELYSPFPNSTWEHMVRNFLAAKDSPDTLKTFVNESLAETWKDTESLDDISIYARREEYGPILPEGVVVLTAGVDVQDDRIECEVVGWGKGEESWGIEFKIFLGDTTHWERGAWADLRTFLTTAAYKNKIGQTISISAICLDTGGHRTQEAYNFIRFAKINRLYGVKGANKPGQPIWPLRASKNKRLKINLFMIGTDSAKDMIYGRLGIKEAGPGYMHFPLEYDEEYFKQLTAEEVRYEKGIKVWRKKSGRRNEALDIRVYSLAALERLKQSPRFNLDKLAERQEKLFAEHTEHSIQETENDETKIEIIKTEPELITKIPRIFANRKSTKGGFVNRWRR